MRSLRQIRIGILGSGQLGRMLAGAAHQMGMHVLIHSKTPDASAAQVVSETRSDFSEFFERSERIIFENEFIDCEPLEPYAEKCLPSLTVMRTLQDKAAQKAHLDQIGVPTVEYVPFDPVQSKADWLQLVRKRFPHGAVLKWARQGYDGRGLFFFKKGEDTRSAEAFIQRGTEQGSVYAEKMLDFDRELALVACRSRSGEFTAYPLVVTEQKNGICHVTYGPATAFGVPKEIEEAIRGWARRLAESLSIVGCFAIEFFQVGSECWVNEIAPRVHNSGHFTMNASATSQFENHLRAVLDVPLGSVECRPAFLMHNLIGPPGIPAATDARAFALPEPGPLAHLHWYGKQLVRSGRKMGHLNASVGEIGKFAAMRARVEEQVRLWEEGFQRG